MRHNFIPIKNYAAEAIQKIQDNSKLGATFTRGTWANPSLQLSHTSPPSRRWGRKTGTIISYLRLLPGSVQLTTPGPNVTDKDRALHAERDNDETVLLLVEPSTGNVGRHHSWPGKQQLLFNHD